MSTLSRSVISLYALRYSNADEDWKIQALFGNNIKFDFITDKILTCQETSANNNNQSPRLYKLRLDLHWDTNGKVFLDYDNRHHPVESYQLRISQRKAGRALHFEDKSKRHLTIGSSFRYQFLFDLQFENGYLYNAPGSDVPFWDHLCIFTYWIINMKNYGVFNSFLDQFIIAVQHSSRTISAENFKMFFQICYKQFSSIEHIVKNDPIALKILIRMADPLSVNQENLMIKNDALELFISIILKNLFEKFETILSTIDTVEWPSFCNGLVTLFVIELAHHKSIEETNDAIILVSRIPDKKRREEIANKLLNLLNNLKYSLSQIDLMKLCKLTRQDRLSLEHLELTHSLESYTDCLTQFITAYQGDHNQLEEMIRNHFTKLLQENHFPIEFVDIAFVLNYIKIQTNEPSDNINAATTRRIQFLFEKNNLLWNKITKYLTGKNGHVSIDDFSHIRDIIFRSFNAYVLYNIDRQLFLSATLIHRDDRTSDYLILWFTYFLCESHQSWMNYEELLCQWTECFVRDRDIFSQIIRQIDMLIQRSTEAVQDNHERVTYFVKHMVTECFQQGNIFDLLANNLHTIQNMRFIDAFKSDFASDQLINFNERIKEMYIDNPLFLLMNISKQQKQQNTLVNHLIALATSMIEINNSEIIHDTFTHPSRQTCIYIILFDESLNSVSIRQQIINSLNDQWMKWKEGDMLVKDVWIWRNFSNEETTIVHQIWTLMAETTGEQYQFDALFNDAYRNLNLKLEMMDNVVTCLNTYCQKATDKNSYETMIDQWNERLEQNNMESIQFPTVVDNIVPYVEKINPYAEARAWREFLNNQSEMNDKIESIESQHRDTDESTWMQNDLLSTKSFASIQIVMMNATLETRETTCEQIIRQAVQSLDDFQRILRSVCTDQSNGSIQQIIDLFPDIRQAENDLEILQPLIGSSNIPRLLSIVSFWKNHFHIKQICAGSIYLSAKVHAIIDSSFLNTLCAIDEQTSGEKCIAIYEQYQNQYERQFSVKVLTFLSYYGSSLELFAFLHSLTADDVYNLEEAVNDHDETLVNTETVFDFALVKNFVDCVYAAVEEKRQWWKETPFLFKHVIACFEDIWQQSQFGDLLKCLESSSLALTSIKRIHLELTDKEQSQRRRIADILRESIIIFFRIGRYDTTFDVNVQLVSQQTTNNDKLKQLTITFTDLSELHDRVRLLEYSSNTNQRYESKVNSNMHDVKQLHNFIEFISIVESIIKTLTHLFKSGHPTVKECLAPEKTFSCIDGKYADLLETSQILTNQLNEWEKTLCNIYKTHIDLTYFSGDQFWLVEDYIYNRSSLSHPGYHLLKFIGIDPNSIEKPVSRPQKPEERLKNLGRLLSQQRHEFISQENIPKRNNVLLIETTNEGILRAIMSLFSRETIPASGHRLFYCTLRTSWIEIRAFVYRCFYSRSLHQLIRPELLSQSIQDNFIRLLCSLIQETPDQTFRMGIITTTKITNQQLIGGLQSMQILTICRDQELLNKVQLKEIMVKLVHGCTLVRSKIAGLGKSTIIRRDIQLQNKTYVKFPIYGDLDIDTLAERLCSKFSQLQTGVIHLDIGLTDNSQSLNELLYSLVIFRSFRFGYVAASIPADVPMYIEIDTSPQSILKELHLIQHLSSPIDLKEFNWKHLDVENKEIQTVANYLQAIANRTITKQNVNESTFIKLDAATCAHLLQDPFLQNKNPEYITWTQLSIFNAVFHRLFEGFSLCGFFLVESVPRPELRMDLVKTLLQSSNQFTSLSVEAVRKQQRAATSDATVTFSDAIVGWDKIQPFTMVFTATNDPLFVYKSSNDVPRALIEYVNAYHRAAKRGTKITTTAMFPDYNELTHDQFFLKLTSLSEKYLNKSICPKCFLQYEFQIERCERCFTKDLLIRPRSLDDDAIKEFQLSIAKQVQMEYVLTKDNFIKMLLIYLRIQSGIPVLIMGETGCGKTSLVQFLCQKILNDELAVFRIHAGVTAQMIIETMTVYIQQAKKCEIQGKRLWIFFDEFNTTKNIGLFKEIMCERTLLGESLPDNMVYLGACNPRRKKANNVSINDNKHIGLQKNRYEMEKLQWTGTDRCLSYTVAAIPETMLEYIWDYGYLEGSIEKAYIETMLNTCRNLTTDRKLFDLTVRLLVESQNHFRELEDASSVSLRDIARFCRLYNWFLDSFVQRNNEGYAGASIRAPPRRASFLALMVCYYFRLNSVDLQKIYVDKLQSIMGKHSMNLVRILETEQNNLIDRRMELPPGIASNRALCNNIFVLFVCIVNHIPVFLCGKPGSSKSSAVQIVISNLKGKKSKDPYFQTLPELVAVSFQGSQNCTSESIIKAFERAAKYSGVKSGSEVLPVIVFDEIGLAELSPHNPLKVLHAELEVEKCKYGFVGVSNWRLDASKMNRALYLSIPDPDITDLQQTATTIVESMQRERKEQFIQIEPIMVERLSQAYNDLCTNKQLEYENYFGLRDFYSLIKGIVNEAMTTKKKANMYEIIRKQLKVNFDGIFDGSSFLWQHFCQSMHQQYHLNEYPCPSFNTLFDRILTVRSGRYLMLIAENDCTIDYCEHYIIKHQKKQGRAVRTLAGSLFPGDLICGNAYTEQYNYRVLMDIILYAETNVTLIMRQMDHLYDNLYDLFNQNFAISARKKYCRISLGALYHPRCFIHDDFYCIVFIYKRDLEKCDPPFLNRFEKHLIDIKALIHYRYRSLSIRLQTWLESLLPRNVGQHFPLLQHLFVDYSQDQICNLIIEAFKQLNISVDDDGKEETDQKILEYCQKRLIDTSSLDFALVLSMQPTADNQKLMDIYFKVHQSITFVKFIEHSLRKGDFSYQIVYTFTSIFETIDALPNTVEEVKLKNFKTELELIKTIKRHYKGSTNIRLLLIRVDYHSDHQHILSLKHVIQNERVSPSNRGVWLVFHLQRNLLNQVTNDISFSGWRAKLIDDLNGRKIISKNVFENSSYRDLVLLPQFFPSDYMWDQLINRCLSKFRYTVSEPNHANRIEERCNKLFQEITQTHHKSTLRSIVEKNLWMLIEKDQTVNKTRFTDWRFDLLTNGITIGGSPSFHNALQMTISIFLEAYLCVLFNHFEKYNFIDAHHFLSNVYEKEVQKQLSQLWIDCLTSTLKNIDVTVMNRGIIEISLIFDLKLPCAATEYETIRCIREKYQLRKQDNKALDDLLPLFIKQLREMSIYGANFIELVLTEEDFFQLYFHDQIVMHLTETKIQLSSKFVIDLFTSNPNRSRQQHIQLLLMEHEQLTNILRLYEISLRLVSEEEISRQIRNQFSSNASGEIKSSRLYTLVLTNQRFYQLPPKAIRIEDQWLFKRQSDPMVETSLMNLIEIILSPLVISRANNIQEVMTTYSLIEQGVSHLPSYFINNIEKLRSFVSLIRCLTTLLPDDSALEILKDVCKDKFDGQFVSCSSIHDFIAYIRNEVKAKHSTANEHIICRTLCKLEIELLKDWLTNNNDSYGEVLTLINEGNNDLWKYSAKIFKLINLKFGILSKLNTNNEKFSFDEKYKQLNQFIKIPANIILQLMVNQFHMHLVLNVQEKDIDQKLLSQYPNLEENLRAVRNVEQLSGIELVLLLTWFKYYTQMYASALSNDSHEEVLHRIDQQLTNVDTPLCSTLKLFIVKQLLQLSARTLNDLRDIYDYRNVVWINLFLQRSCDKQAQNIRRNFILPTPLFELREQSERVSKIFNEVINKVEQLQRLIRECNTSHQLSYAFLCWFTHYYARFSLPNTEVDSAFVKIIEQDLSRDLIDSFTLVGYRFLVGMCENFSENSYFRLRSTMTPQMIHQRMLAVNIFTVILSYKSLPEITLLGNLLFNTQRQMPVSFIEHLSTICLPGLTVTDPIITQMKDVRTQVQDRDSRGQIFSSERFIYQCSQECLWMFYFEDCGAPNDEDNCPLCQKPIGAQSHGVLIERDPPQLKIPLAEAFQKINEYIIRYNQTDRLGYHNAKTASESTSGEKPDHLERPVSFRFIHFVIHGLLLFLHDQNYLNDHDLTQRLHLATTTHFRDHFETDCALLAEASADQKEYYIWLYKLLGHLVDTEFAKQGLMNTNESVLQIEKLIEDKLIFVHIDSVANEITDYNMAYAQFIQERDTEPSLENFIDELFEDEKKFPLLNFFNVTTFHIANPLDEFILKMKSLPYGEQTYPITTFLLKQFDKYSNIKHLFPMVIFTNYLINKLSYRIKRYAAMTTTIAQYLTKERDRKTVQQLYEQFLHALYAINLKEVRYGCQTRRFELPAQQERFTEDMSIALLLLNTSNDATSLLLVACLTTLAELQNEIVNYFDNTIEYANGRETRRKHVSLQAIRSEHILYLDRNELSRKLIDDSLVLNYQYGKGKDSIYDYEEIEIFLRNKVSSLVLIDTDKLHFFTYQFELYNANFSLINDVRALCQQAQLPKGEQTKLVHLIANMDNEVILRYLGSLDNVFTYLRNVVLGNTPEMTIQLFIERHLHSRASLNDNILQQPPFSEIQLRYIIHLYEMLEETAFDKVLRPYVKAELMEGAFSDEERQQVLREFYRDTLEKETLAKTLKDVEHWISMLKRLMLRVLNANISLDVPLQLYLERSDLWTDQVNNDDLTTFQVDDKILLRHTYVILRGLEKKQEDSNTAQQRHRRPSIQSVDEQHQKAYTWFTGIEKSTTVPKRIAQTKIRV